MGAFADSLFTLMLGWVRWLVGAVTTLFSSGGENGLIPFLGKNWLVIVLALLAIGLVGDWFVWMVRWQPYRVWGTKMRRIARALHLRPQQESDAEQDENEAPAQEESAYAPPAQEDKWGGTRQYQRAGQPGPAETVEDAAGEENIDFAHEAALDLPPLTQEDEAAAMAAAENAQDAQAYPGMRYDMSAYMRPQEESGAEYEDAEYEASEYEAAEAETAEYAEEYTEEYEDAGYEDEAFNEAALYDAQVDESDDLTDAAYDESAQEAEPTYHDGAQDGEWAAEIDPLAAYEQSSYEQPVYEAPAYEQEADGLNVYEAPMQEEPAQEATSRRRRRRRSEME